LQKALAIFSLGRGVIQAWQGIQEFDPELVVGFGSFHSFPVLVAAFLRGIPFVLFESNSIPGRVNRLFSRYALFSGIVFPKAQKRMKGICKEVNMPFWGEKVDKKIAKKEAVSYFSLQENVFTLLVFGGSQGAVSLNPIVAEAIGQFHREKGPVQVIHLTGSPDSAEKISKLYQQQGVYAVVKPFEEKMYLAWASADLAICRAGAATLAEMMQFEVPSVLVPYPAAAEQHQKENALFMQDVVKGSFCLEQNQLTSQKLFSVLSKCDLQEMKHSMRLFSEKKTKIELIDCIEEYWFSKE
jgi:UDP-N-acetylglucosamine--N-acetylmuramyl-(pentapeptide) pyrophosphoryl-undecaprenol N-acetylglucosamine transferase